MRRKKKKNRTKMSLVDYASSDEDDMPEIEEKNGEKLEIDTVKEPQSQPHHHSASEIRPILVQNKPLESISDSSMSSIELPDASLLLNSPTSSGLFGGSDHSSRVAAAMAANASRKRETNVLSSSLPRNKVPRSTLPHSKNSPDTLGRLLVPPQLTGRKNIVTEDISKLFVKKSVKPSSE